MFSLCSAMFCYVFSWWNTAATLLREMQQWGLEGLKRVRGFRGVRGFGGVTGVKGV